MNEEREERRRMNDVRDRMDTAQRKRDRAGPGSSLGAIGDRFTLLPPSCRQGEGTDDSQEAQIRCDEEDEEISIPHLVLQIERGANGHSRTVARDDRVAGQPHEVGRAEMNLPSFVRQKVSFSHSSFTRSISLSPSHGPLQQDPSLRRPPGSHPISPSQLKNYPDHWIVHQNVVEPPSPIQSLPTKYPLESATPPPLAIIRKNDIILIKITLSRWMGDRLLRMGRWVMIR